MAEDNSFLHIVLQETVVTKIILVPGYFIENQHFYQLTCYSSMSEF